jgi:hypothetical protein
MNNFERIKNMDIIEMAKWLADEIPHGDCYGCNLCYTTGSCLKGWLEYLKHGTDFDCGDKSDNDEDDYDDNPCFGCIYEDTEDTTDLISNCVCCNRNNELAKNDNYKAEQDFSYEV